ncbi:hypothetical protein BDV18DRAFT_11562 [Aspergillus unguis]
MAVLNKPNGGHGSSLKTSLHRSQQAPGILGQQASNTLFSRFLTSNQESTDDFGAFEKLFFSCIQSADDKCALTCLERLTQRFGSSNERVMALHSIYNEAISRDQSGLERCLKKCDDILSQNPVNMPIIKRRIALLTSLSRYAEAISGLVQLLEATPTDAEAWCELAELYQSQGMSTQAIFSLEEALLIVPHAWNIHARMGEILYVHASSLENDDMTQQLQSSTRYFCRSLELCDNYLRGFYGLALATSRLKQAHLDRPEKEAYMHLHGLAKDKLKGILATQYSLEPHLREYEENELTSVQRLLSDFSE